ncbi:FUSC family protein [Methylomicrobium sp. Wu6]|uniref:FUSC family protein n=1 Tax=Methylomicrobium sp. Wu6 TaxID=3107928 RepID=UPI002DD680F2|nr:FUSC family protein [Methylomicrobium sp. Wu6]MEC4749437.1 FUSC family protein [Methylomicrobium sp. Wu6]
MKTGDTAPVSTQSKNPGTLWFGTSLWQFLKVELSDFPGRRLAALRVFIVVLTIALVSETLHIAPLAPIAIALSMNCDPYLNAGQSLTLGVRQFGYVIVTAFVSVGALIFAGDAPWLLLPLSFTIMALALFHARLIAWPTSIALLYATSVLYSPSTPADNIYSALWNIPIIGILAIGTWTLVQLSIKPQDPLKLLTFSIAEQLSAVENILGAHLTDDNANSDDKKRHKLLTPGSFGKTHDLLTHAELIHPSLYKHHDTYLALLIEIDGLRQIAIWLDQVLTAEHRGQAMGPQRLDMYLALQSVCSLLRQGMEQWRDVSGQASALLPDKILPADLHETSPSLLTAMWRALQRIAGLMHSLHESASSPEMKPMEAETEFGDTAWLPAWFGYEFWSTHADTLQYAIKFSLGAILCTLIVESLAWPAINTAIITCIITAQTSLGADYRISLLRLSGSALGGLCAYLYVLVFQSQIDSIVGFTLATAPVWAISAWISAGSDRIAYMGRQIAFSLALFVLHDFGAVTDLNLSRDRVIGILLGIIVMGVLDYALWPRRSIALARIHSASALHTIARFTAWPPELSQMLKSTLPLRLSAEKDLSAAQSFVIHALLEPDAGLADQIKERAALGTIIEDAGNLSGLLLVRRRYRLLGGLQLGKLPDALQEHSRAFDAELARALENAALMLHGEQLETRTTVADIHAQLTQSYSEHHRIDSLPADKARDWELRFMLDHQIMALVEQIEQKALNSVSYRQTASPPIDR